MQEFNFRVTGTERKRLAGAISEILNTPMKYLGAPTFGYEIGGYTISKDGIVSGEYDLNFFLKLANNGFEPETDNTEGENLNKLVIEMPRDSFTTETLENLYKMVKSKENLLMSALGTDNLSVQVFEDKICFPWFSITEDSDRVKAYAQLISALCTTAKEKKRVTAKTQNCFENEKFAMRVWLISLGCIGAEYKYLRKIMGEFLGGNSAWRSGKPEKVTIEAEVADNE